VFTKAPSIFGNRVEFFVKYHLTSRRHRKISEHQKTRFVLLSVQIAMQVVFILIYCYADKIGGGGEFGGGGRFFIKVTSGFFSASNV